MASVGAVRRAGPVEEREDVRGALLEGPAELADLGQRGRDAAGDGVDHGLHHGLAMLVVGFAVGGDHALVDAPGRLDLDVLRDREQGFETGLLLLGEQRGAGVEGAPRGIEQVALAAAVPAGDLLDAAAALVQHRVSCWHISWP